MLRIKNFMQKGERTAPINKSKNPWLIERVKNGLKAVNVKILSDLIRPEKAIKSQYFENDRIYGKGAFKEDGVLRVMTVFDELKDITPYTVGYIFNKCKYYYHDDGILKKDLKTSEEEYFSEKTLRNENIDNFFKLLKCEPVIEVEIEDDEENSDRSTVYNSNTELTKV